MTDIPTDEQITAIRTRDQCFTPSPDGPFWGVEDFAKYDRRTLLTKLDALTTERDALQRALDEACDKLKPLMPATAEQLRKP